LRISLLIVGLALSASASLCAAQGATFLANSPLLKLQKDEVPALRELLDTTLDQAADGETRSWDNLQGSNPHKLTVTLTPTRSYERMVQQQKLPCRSVRVNIKAKAQQDRVNASYCKRDERWVSLFELQHPRKAAK
jgi:hypothetical protein